MATEMTMETRWVLKLDPDDARIMLRALGNRNRNDDEVAEAVELGNRLTQLRSKQASHLAAEMQKHVNNAEKSTAHKLLHDEQKCPCEDCKAFRIASQLPRVVR